MKFKTYSIDALKAQEFNEAKNLISNIVKNKGFNVLEVTQVKQEFKIPKYLSNIPSSIFTGLKVLSGVILVVAQRNGDNPHIQAWVKKSGYDCWHQLDTSDIEELPKLNDYSMRIYQEHQALALETDNITLELFD